MAASEHSFTGRWITNGEFADLAPRNVFFKQLERVALSCAEHRDRHILFRRTFALEKKPARAVLYITADDYYKLYVNGTFVAQGPAPAYHFRYGYNVVDLTPYLHEGDNLLAVHTLYQGLINRVWQSGDLRHGLLLDLVADGDLLLCSDPSFKVRAHTGYRETGVVGYQTQFLEEYDSASPEAQFADLRYDDTDWESAAIRQNDDHEVRLQKSAMLEFEEIRPVSVQGTGQERLYDFGAVYVGYPVLAVRGRKGDRVIVRCAQELQEDGTPRFALRANCTYEEPWLLADGVSRLDAFDYKSFRYLQVILPDGAEIVEAAFLARHYPFAIERHMRPAFAGDEALKSVWDLCVRTLKYGVQEVIQDCMEREKGFYLGDGCYSALAHMVLTKDDSMVRKLIDDAFASSFITKTLVTCMDCSFMQEIAEYPLILVSMVLWHYRLTGDRAYLSENYHKVTALLEAYRASYEKDGLLRELDKWCVVEWPANYRHGYDVDIREGQVCHDAHVSINAYYIQAVRTANRMAGILQVAPYRDPSDLERAFRKTFYVPDEHLCRDGENTPHISLVGNSFVYAFELDPDPVFKDRFLGELDRAGIHSLSFFCTFPVLSRLARDGDLERLRNCLSDEGAWLRMIREDAKVTFEGWGRDVKWNTSLFHLTMSYAAVFLADLDLEELFS